MILKGGIKMIDLKFKLQKILFLWVILAWLSLFAHNLQVYGYWTNYPEIPRLPTEIMDVEKEKLALTDVYIEGEIVGIDLVAKKVFLHIQESIFQYPYTMETVFFLNGERTVIEALRPVTKDDFCLAKLYFNQAGKLLLIEGLYYVLNIKIEQGVLKENYLLIDNQFRISCAEDCQWIICNVDIHEILISLDFRNNIRKIWME